MDSLLANDEFNDIVYWDDKERFLEMLSCYPKQICMAVMARCAIMRAKKCLLAMLDGEGCIPSTRDIYANEAAFCAQYAATPLATVARYFSQAHDIVHLLLKRGHSDHTNLKCSANHTFDLRCPLDHLLFALSYELELYMWAPGNSLLKLVLLLCQWKLKSSLDSARLLAPHTDGINEIAWSYVREGRLVSFAALLLVAQEKVFAKFDPGLSHHIGSTIRERITEMVDALRSEGDLDDEGAIYQCMLIDACKLLDIFERAGGALSSYCSSIPEYDPPHKVLIDVAGILKEAGFVLQPMDLDLRDCYREYPELSKARLFKLSDPPSSNKEQLFPSSIPRAKGLGATRYKYPSVWECHFLHKVKSGPMVNLVPSAASIPRLFSIVAVQIDNGTIPLKHLAYIACRLKRGMKL